MIYVICGMIGAVFGMAALAIVVAGRQSDAALEQALDRERELWERNAMCAECKRKLKGGRA